MALAQAAERGGATSVQLRLKRASHTGAGRRRARAPDRRAPHPGPGQRPPRRRARRGSGRGPPGPGRSPGLPRADHRASGLHPRSLGRVGGGGAGRRRGGLLGSGSLAGDGYQGRCRSCARERRISASGRAGGRQALHRGRRGPAGGCAAVLAAGGAGVAVVSGILADADPEVATRRYALATVPNPRPMSPGASEGPSRRFGRLAPLSVTAQHLCLVPSRSPADARCTSWRTRAGRPAPQRNTGTAPWPG